MTLQTTVQISTRRTLRASKTKRTARSGSRKARPCATRARAPIAAPCAPLGRQAAQPLGEATARQRNLCGRPGAQRRTAAPRGRKKSVHGNTTKRPRLRSRWQMTCPLDILGKEREQRPSLYNLDPSNSLVLRSHSKPPPVRRSFDLFAHARTVYGLAVCSGSRSVWRDSTPFDESM